MQVDILKPNGYCFGVKNAINVAIKARKDYPDADIFVLGMLVHNEHVINNLKEHNIHTIDVSPSSYEEEINKLNKGNVIIFTAHGHDEKLDQKALDKGLIVIDAVCPIVKNNELIMKDELNKGHQIIYIGKENHPESYAAKSLSDDVKVLYSKLPFNYQLITDNSPFVANQTTFNYLELKDIHDDIKRHIPQARIANEICSATRLRQECVANLDKQIDCLIVVGSTKSSNTMRLVEIAKSFHKDLDVMLASNENDIDKTLLINKKHVAIISGTSTPDNIIEHVYNYLIKE